MFREGTLGWAPREHPSALCALGKGSSPTEDHSFLIWEAPVPGHQNSGLKSELSKFNISSLHSF